MPIIPPPRRQRQVAYCELEAGLSNIEALSQKHISHAQRKKMFRDDLFSIVVTVFSSLS